MLGFDAIAGLPLGDDADAAASPVSTYITTSGRGDKPVVTTDRGDQPIRSS